jgi:hypothetical protein
VPEGVSNSVDKAKESVNSVIDSVENNAETVIDKTKTIGSEKLGDAVKNK